MNSQTIVDYIIKNEDTLKIDLLFSYLKKFKLEYLMSDVLTKLKKYNKREKENSKIILESPVQINNNTQSSLESKYNLKIEEFRTNQNLVAGYKLYSKDRIVDASIDTLLKNFTK